MPIYTSEVNKAGDAVIHNSGTGSTINSNFTFQNSAGNAADGSIGMVARSNTAFVLGTTGESVPTGTDAYAISLNDGFLMINNGNFVKQDKTVTITFWACAPGTGYNAGVGFSANAEDAPGDGHDIKVQMSNSVGLGGLTNVSATWKRSSTTLDPEAFSDLAGNNGTIDHTELSTYSGGGGSSAASVNKILHAYKISFKLSSNQYVRISGGSASNNSDDVFLYDLRVKIEDHDDDTTSKISSRESLTLQIDKDSTSHPSTAKFSFVAGDTSVEVANIDESGNLQLDGTIKNSENEDTITLDADQRVGIGGISPTYKLDVDGDIRVRGNDIRDNSGNPAITFDGSANTTVTGDLTVSGNDIKGSGGTAITMDGSNNVTVAGDLTVSGGKVTLTNGSIIDSETENELKLTEDLVSLSGDLKLGGDVIKASDGANTLTLDPSSDRLTVLGGVTFGGNFYDSVNSKVVYGTSAPGLLQVPTTKSARSLEGGFLGVFQQADSSAWNHNDKEVIFAGSGVALQLDPAVGTSFYNTHGPSGLDNLPIMTVDGSNDPTGLVETNFTGYYEVSGTLIIDSTGSETIEIGVRRNESISYSGTQLMYSGQVKVNSATTPMQISFCCIDYIPSNSDYGVWVTVEKLASTTTTNLTAKAGCYLTVKFLGV